jgi:hypothetical protein
MNACQLSVPKASQEATVLVTAAIVAVVMTPQNLDRRSARNAVRWVIRKGQTRNGKASQFTVCWKL